MSPWFLIHHGMSNGATPPTITFTVVTKVFMFDSVPGCRKDSTCRQIVPQRTTHTVSKCCKLSKPLTRACHQFFRKWIVLRNSLVSSHLRSKSRCTGLVQLEYHPFSAKSVSPYHPASTDRTETTNPPKICSNERGSCVIEEFELTSFPSISTIIVPSVQPGYGVASSMVSRILALEMSVENVSSALLSSLCD